MEIFLLPPRVKRTAATALVTPSTVNIAAERCNQNPAVGGNGFAMTRAGKRNIGFRRRPAVR
jgi:hypothetical protein